MKVWACRQCGMPVEPRVDHGGRLLCSRAGSRCVPQEAPLSSATGAVLGKLKMLADGATLNLDPNRVHGGATKSKPPSRGRGMSLYEFYRAEFERYADDENMTRTLWMLACDDYEDFRFRSDYRVEVRRGEVLENDPADPGAADRAQAQRIIDWYEGKPPLYVAMRESRMGALVTEAWVCKKRRDHGRNPEDGRPQAPFLDLDDDARRAEVAKHVAPGVSQQTVANRLGVGKTTVQRYWPAECLAAT